MKYYFSFLSKIVAGLALLGILSFTVAHFSLAKPTSNSQHKEVQTPDSTRSKKQNGNHLVQDSKKQSKDACAAPSRTSLRKVK